MDGPSDEYRAGWNAARSYAQRTGSVPPLPGAAPVVAKEPDPPPPPPPPPESESEVEDDDGDE